MTRQPDNSIPLAYDHRPDGWYVRTLGNNDSWHGPFSTRQDAVRAIYASQSVGL